MALLEVENLWVVRKSRGLFSGAETQAHSAAVKDVSLSVPKNGITGVAGETGCGKSSLALTILKVLQPHSGTMVFDGTPIQRMPEWRFRRFRKHIQLLYSHPKDSFHPRWTVNRLFDEVFQIHQSKLSSGERFRKMQEYLRMVGLSPKVMRKYPRDLSLFDQQRLAIARVLVIHPKLLICDDPSRYLDTVSQARLLDLLKDLHEFWNISMLFMARDYSVIDHMCDYIHVMSLGRILESGTPHDLYHAPQHEYTRQLLALSGAL